VVAEPDHGLLFYVSEEQIIDIDMSANAETLIMSAGVGAAAPTRRKRSQRWPDG